MKAGAMNVDNTSIDDVVETSKYFAKNWYDAKSIFIKYTEDNRSHMESIPITVENENYTIDIAWYGDVNAKNVLLVTSGIHGVEGFAGSAIQCAFIEHFLNKIQSKSNVAVVIVHCINPYGMQHIRRVNENNVDLNRNFLPYPHVQGGISIQRKALEPLLNKKRSQSLSVIKLIGFLIKHGVKNLSAIGEGQYVYSDSLFYGGSRIEEEPKKIIRFLENNMKDRMKIVHIDLHMGIGKKNDVKLFQTIPASEGLREPLNAYLGKWISVAHTRTNSRNDSSVEFSASGMFNEAIVRYCDSKEVATFTMELGTKGHLKLIQALRDENYIHQMGLQKTKKGKKIKQKTLEYFCLPEQYWRKNAIKTGVKILSNAYTMLNK